MVTQSVWLPYLDVMFFSCEHSVLSVHNLMGDQFDRQSVHDTCSHRRTAKDYCRAICIFELFVLQRGLLIVPGIVFFQLEILTL